MSTKYREIRRELLRALRGERTQGQLNRKLGFKANQVYRWEAGTQAIRWKDFVRLCHFCKINLRATCTQLLKFEKNPAHSKELALHFVGAKNLTRFAKETSISRFKVARWLNGQSDFTLDEVLELIERTQSGLIDFVVHLTNGEGIPMLRRESEAKRRYAQLLRRKPWSSIVRVCLDMAKYSQTPVHERGFIARLTGISLEKEDELVEDLIAAGAISWKNGKLQLNPMGASVRSDHETDRLRIRYWAEHAAKIFAKHGDKSKSRFQLLIFSASEETVAEVREETVKYYTRIRAIFAADKNPTARVQVLGMQLLDMDDFGDLSATEVS